MFPGWRSNVWEKSTSAVFRRLLRWFRRRGTGAPVANVEARASTLVRRLTDDFADSHLPEPITGGASSVGGQAIVRCIRCTVLVLTIITNRPGVVRRATPRDARGRRPSKNSSGGVVTEHRAARKVASSALFSQVLCGLVDPVLHTVPPAAALAEDPPDLRSGCSRSGPDLVDHFSGTLSEGPRSRAPGRTVRSNLPAARARGGSRRSGIRYSSYHVGPGQGFVAGGVVASRPQAGAVHLVRSRSRTARPRWGEPPRLLASSVCFAVWSFSMEHGRHRMVAGYSTSGEKRLPAVFRRRRWFRRRCHRAPRSNSASLGGHHGAALHRVGRVDSAEVPTDPTRTRSADPVTAGDRRQRNPVRGVNLHDPPLFRDHRPVGGVSGTSGACSRKDSSSKMRSRRGASVSSSFARTISGDGITQAGHRRGIDASVGDDRASFACAALISRRGALRVLFPCAGACRDEARRRAWRRTNRASWLLFRRIRRRSSIPAGLHVLRVRRVATH